MVNYSHSRSNSGEAKVAQVVHHDQYYLRGGDVTFLVENQLFRVHRYFFERESPFFYTKLVAPASPGQVPKGTSDANAFTLDSVTAADFSRFLWVFYNPKYSLYDTTQDEWVSILRLAHEWQFSEVKNLVVRELEKMTIDPIPKIVIYHKYDIDRKYLIHSYAALCAREEPLSLQEGMELGLETALTIAKARECARGKQTSSGARSPTFAGLEEPDMHAVVRDVFSIPTPEVTSPTTEDPSGTLESTPTFTSNGISHAIGAAAGSTNGVSSAGASNSTETNGVQPSTANPNGSANGASNGAQGADETPKVEIPQTGKTEAQASQRPTPPPRSPANQKTVMERPTKTLSVDGHRTGITSGEERGVGEGEVAGLEQAGPSGDGQGQNGNGDTAHSVGVPPVDSNDTKNDGVDGVNGGSDNTGGNPNPFENMADLMSFTFNDPESEMDLTDMHKVSDDSQQDGDEDFFDTEQGPWAL